MSAVRFVQFLRPDGRQKFVEIDRPPDIAEKADRMVEAGWRFEAEVLLTGHASFTVEDDQVDETGAIAHEIVPNGPPVIDAVDRLIQTAYTEFIRRQN